MCTHIAPPRLAQRSCAEFLLRTSYLIPSLFSCDKVIAHHKARIYLHTCPNKILEKRCDANPHAGYRRSAYQGGFVLTGALIYSPRIVPALLLPPPSAQLRCAYLLHFVLRTSYLALAPPPTVVLLPLSPPCPSFSFLICRSGSVSRILSTHTGCVVIFLAVRRRPCSAGAECD